MITPASEAKAYLTRKIVEGHTGENRIRVEQTPIPREEVIVELPGLTGPAEKLFAEKPARLLAATSTAFRRYHRRIGLHTSDIDPMTENRTQLGEIRAELAMLGKVQSNSGSYDAAKNRAVELASLASIAYGVSSSLPEANKGK